MLSRTPTTTSIERARRFGVEQSTICYALKRLGLSNKKTLFHPKADQQSRLSFQQKLLRYGFIDKRLIVCLDESGFAVEAYRDMGYRLEKCYAGKDWHAKGRVNAIGAIIDFKLINVCLFHCNINADVFHTWLTLELLPNIPEHSVIVLDNTAFHKRNDALLAIQQRCFDFIFDPILLNKSTRITMIITA